MPTPLKVERDREHRSDGYLSRGGEAAGVSAMLVIASRIAQA